MISARKNAKSEDSSSVWDIAYQLCQLSTMAAVMEERLTKNVSEIQGGSRSLKVWVQSHSRESLWESGRQAEEERTRRLHRQPRRVLDCGNLIAICRTATSAAEIAWAPIDHRRFLTITTTTGRKGLPLRTTRKKRSPRWEGRVSGSVSIQTTGPQTRTQQNDRCSSQACIRFLGSQLLYPFHPPDAFSGRQAVSSYSSQNQRFTSL